MNLKEIEGQKTSQSGLNHRVLSDHLVHLLQDFSIQHTKSLLQTVMLYSNSRRRPQISFQVPFANFRISYLSCFFAVFTSEYCISQDLSV